MTHRQSNTSISRSMGYLSAPSIEEKVYSQSNIIVMGPKDAAMRSYHVGPSNKELWLKQKEAKREAFSRL